MATTKTRTLQPDCSRGAASRSPSSTRARSRHAPLRRLRQRPAATGRRAPQRRAEAVLPQASTLIYGDRDAVLTDPGMTTDQARALGDWVAGKGRNLTDIFITHGHGDHWFAAGLLAERFGARIVASAGTIAQMHGNAATRPCSGTRSTPASRRRPSPR